MLDFIADLDEYFCEKYANYDRLCVLKGYRMPKMQDSRVDEFGRTYAYTLPAETMRLALQENKTELLAELKEKLHDRTFSFSFVPLSFFARMRSRFGKYGFWRVFRAVAERNKLSFDEIGKSLNVEEKIWKRIANGRFAPTKNLLFTIALTSHLSMQDTTLLFACAGYEWNYAEVKDVVLSYLLDRKAFNRSMVETALREYKVENLFFLPEETAEK